MSLKKSLTGLEARSQIFSIAHGVKDGALVGFCAIALGAVAGIWSGATALAALGLAIGATVPMGLLAKSVFRRGVAFRRVTEVATLALATGAVCAFAPTRRHEKASLLSRTAPLSLQFDRACKTLVQTGANEVTITVPKGCRMKLQTP